MERGAFISTKVFWGSIRFHFLIHDYLPLLWGLVLASGTPVKEVKGFVVVD